jgi:hypothetical protein
MTDTMTSQNIVLSSWDTLYVPLFVTNFVPVINMSQIAVYGLVQSKKSSVQMHSDFKTGNLTLKYDDDLARTDMT